MWSQSRAATPPAAQSGGTITVWDPVVRLFHWLVVAGVTTNMFLNEEGKPVHRWVGYAVLLAVLVRVIWGVAGSAHARFADFIPMPSRLWSYGKSLLARREPRYIGHNPAAAVMMVTLILLLVLCGVTGWMQGLDAFWGMLWVQDVHKAAAYTILALAGVHVLAAIRESVRHRENLIWSMITGRKRAPSGSDIDHAPASGRG
ncbi:MAG: cytochrome b/b6 domain-containing protein [Alphaproteobacteria bacterium]|nr:cytochrome b/b6 domain-containing protein [Alphaproteobacteria bacterium]MDE2111353.1 cytochrome b/b6 domain-containing protein [Alphaproteobacteria bacterium]MDE2495594.1 cytochrome b/b6 domain-containing protein [Alphaproteobacteria bacterium]